MNASPISQFRLLARLTLIMVFLLIGIGSYVRSAGAGMGCPDWPTCFGQWIPPTSVDQLPPDYEQAYIAHRMEKNERFASFLTLIGLNDVAEAMTSEGVNQAVAFNARHTWIEYINRLVGVLVGFLMILMAIFSFRLRKVNRQLVVFSLAVLGVTIFQGWFGSIVVSTNLTPWTVNIHLFLALAIVALLSYIITHIDPLEEDFELSVTTRSFILAGLAVTIIQTFMGVHVREKIDAVSSTLPRGQWMDSVGDMFSLHRGYAWIVTLMMALIYLNFRRYMLWSPSFKWITGAIVVSFLTGIAMTYFEMPEFSQPLHLVAASVIFGMTLMLFWNTKIKGYGA